MPKSARNRLNAAFRFAKNDMQQHLAFILSSIEQGRTVLAYDRRVANAKVYHIKTADRVTMIGDVLHVDSIPAKGWTFALKP